ncbi:MAG: helix-turn-helix domain-containing protein [Archangium sp.]
MDRAASLVWTTDLPLGHVAMEVGYSSASRFTERFHERFGVLPSDLRARR